MCRQHVFDKIVASYMAKGKSRVEAEYIAEAVCSRIDRKKGTKEW